MPAPNQISTHDLLQRLGTADAPRVIDVCIDPDFADDPHLIPGSVRHSHTDLSGLRDRLQGEACVVVCQKGLKLSQGVAAWLRANGQVARYLAGGMFAWRDHQGAPRLPAVACPPLADGDTLWVTPERPTLDRLASLWLIRRFLDQQARVLFVESAETETVADRFGAISFETFATPLAAPGACVTFGDMLNRFHLSLPSLHLLAARLEAPELQAIVRGLRHQGLPDLSQVDATLPIFDALHACARADHERRAA